MGQTPVYGLSDPMEAITEPTPALQTQSSPPLPCKQPECGSLWATCSPGLGTWVLPLLFRLCEILAYPPSFRASASPSTGTSAEPSVGRGSAPPGFSTLLMLQQEAGADFTVNFTWLTFPALLR